MVATIIPKYAVICAQCNAISNANGEACPACGSNSLFNLARMLDRKEVLWNNADMRRPQQQTDN